MEQSMALAARFPDVATGDGFYESFYLRAVSPKEPRGVWIRHTVHKRPGCPPVGSVWCTVFDASIPARSPFTAGPYMHKESTDELSAPPDGGIAVGSSQLAEGHAEGACGEASWSLRFATDEPELRHLPGAWLYRSPLPRTKLSTPMPAARFTGTLQLDATLIELDGWRGMVGHNWGSQHAERWIWLHALDFQEQPQTWLDVAIGRVKLAGALSPWVANGALSLDGRRLRLGGLRARGLRVLESPRRCTLSLPGEHGLHIEAHIDTPPSSCAGWRYADPDGSEHDVVNCSIASLAITARMPEEPARTLESSHGAVYELGMREHDHGVPLAPFGDG
jgi:hypothetical protein